MIDGSFQNVNVKQNAISIKFSKGIPFCDEKYSKNHSLLPR